jgi:ABC-2 type transport system ATP-binding protein
VDHTNAIAIDGLVKRYGDHVAVDGLDLTVPTGTVFGLLGPNGAGKTTTIRTILDLIRPSAGRISVFGLDSRADSIAIRRRIGYLPGELSLYETLTGSEFLAFLAGLRGGVDAHYQAALIERFEVIVDRPIRQLSRGNKQKLGLVQALDHRSDLLLLDEPTSGLDPLVQEEFHRVLAEVHAQGCTVFLSSHVLSEVQHLAQRVAIVRGGKLIVESDVVDLRERAPRHVEIVGRGPLDPGFIAALASVTDVHLDGRSLRCTVVGHPNELIAVLAGIDLESVTIAEPELEDVFLELYRTPATVAAQGR